jgi:hypothetical protein
MFRSFILGHDRPSTVEIRKSQVDLSNQTDWHLTEQLGDPQVNEHMVVA